MEPWILLLLIVGIGISSYIMGKLKEKLNTLARAKRATDAFYARRGCVPNWRTASDLLAYVSGTRPFPDKLMYNSFYDQVFDKPVE